MGPRAKWRGDSVLLYQRPRWWCQTESCEGWGVFLSRRGRRSTSGWICGGWRRGGVSRTVSCDGFWLRWRLVLVVWDRRRLNRVQPDRRLGFVQGVGSLFVGDSGRLGLRLFGQGQSYLAFFALDWVVFFWVLFSLTRVAFLPVLSRR